MDKNIKFEYLYRDAGNYKNRGEVVFYNKNQLSIEAVKQMISQSLIDKLYFVASDLKIKDLRFPEFIPSLDHDWHEFSECTYTNDAVDDIENRDINEIIQIACDLYQEENPKNSNQITNPKQ